MAERCGESLIHQGAAVTVRAPTVAMVETALGTSLVCRALAACKDRPPPQFPPSLCHSSEDQAPEYEPQLKEAPAGLSHQRPSIGLASSTSAPPSTARAATPAGSAALPLSLPPTRLQGHESTSSFSHPRQPSRSAPAVAAAIERTRTVR